MTLRSQIIPNGFTNLADVQEKFAFLHTSENTILYQNWYRYTDITFSIQPVPSSNSESDKNDCCQN